MCFKTGHLDQVVRGIADKQGLVDYNVDIKPGKEKGDGFLGDIFMATVTSPQKVLHLIIKCSYTEENLVEKYHINEVFNNEKTIYRDVLPALDKFQNDRGISSKFTAKAKYYGSSTENGQTLIVLENLKTRGFELYDKTRTFDDEHMRAIFTQYGRLHALSYAYRDQDTEGFRKISGDLRELWGAFAEGDGFKIMLNKILEEVTQLLDEHGDEKLIEKIKKYTDVCETFTNASRYQGNYPVILHGDCWSNNMMFKYKNKDGKKSIEDMCFLDWQLANLGSVVKDLSYFFYSSAGKECLDNLDTYLKIYYDNLTTTSKELGSDLSVVIPFSTLKEEWKECSQFGFLLGLMMQRMKLVKREDVVDLTDISGGESEHKFVEVKYDTEVFKKRALDLTIHYNDIGVL